MSRVNLFGQGREALSALVAGWGEPPYRARQIHRWLYRKRARDVEALSNLGRGLRARLAEGHEIRWPEVVRRTEARDGTVKLLFGLGGGATVETVAMPEERRQTVCISTQAGCPLACAFCLTGLTGYRRNLGPAEILGQVATVMEDPSADPARPWNVVVMGMGEPLLNLEATLESLRILMDPDGFGLPPRRVTLSTVGILPGLEKLAAEPVRPNLAISLHAADPELRQRLMPIEARYPLAAVVEAARRYPSPSGGVVTYEYVLLRGVNDSARHARDLARLLADGPAKVNLIPLNPAPEIPFEPPTEAAVDTFCRVLSGAGVTVSVRRSRGQDILAACGQLQLAERRPPGMGRRLPPPTRGPVA